MDLQQCLIRVAMDGFCVVENAVSAGEVAAVRQGVERVTEEYGRDAAKAKALHSAVDVSHRNVGIMVEGEGAEACLAAGCPQDLSLAAFPVDACSRTVLGKVEIVLWRTDEQAFRVEVWRSFADYAFAFLAEAARDV